MSLAPLPVSTSQTGGPAGRTGSAGKGSQTAGDFGAMLKRPGGDKGKPTNAAERTVAPAPKPERQPAGTSSVQGLPDGNADRPTSIVDALLQKLVDARKTAREDNDQHDDKQVNKDEPAEPIAIVGAMIAPLHIVQQDADTGDEAEAGADLDGQADATTPAPRADPGTSIPAPARTEAKSDGMKAVAAEAQLVTAQSAPAETIDAPGETVEPTASADRKPAGRDSAPMADQKVSVIASQTAMPAPSFQGGGMSATGANLVAALASDGALPAYAAENAGQAAQALADARPVNILKIQLTPVELGVVTVKLTGSGENLAIEIQVETGEARHRLAADSEAIVRSLQGLGYDIDRITVQQVPVTQSAQSSGAQSGGRDGGSFQQFGDRAGEGRGDRGGQQGDSGRQDHNDSYASAVQSDRPAASGGVYI